MTTLSINGRDYRVDSRALDLSDHLLQAAAAALGDWTRHFPVEATWTRLVADVPSGVVRLDCVEMQETDGSTGLFIYEVEDRPLMIGFMATIDDAFRQRLQGVMGEWSRTDRSGAAPCVVPLDDYERDYPSDDRAWTKVRTLDDALLNDRLMLARGHLSEALYDAVAPRTICPLRFHGTKSYGEGMAWWRPLAPLELRDGSDVWSNPFVLKPQTGEGGRGVVLWAPDESRAGIGGSSTKPQIRRAMDTYGPMYLQRYVPPMRCPFLDGAQMILRMYFAYSPLREAYVPLGGFWNARPKQIKIHGASDAVYGAVNVWTR